MSHLEPNDPEPNDLEPLDLELDADELTADELTADNFDYSALNTLGNRAIALGLLIGHGYHQGEYELLPTATDTVPATPLLLSPRQAYGYLKSLILSWEQTHG
jgi:hypothetical protein